MVASCAVIRSSRRDRSIRENADDMRTKTIRILGAMIVVSWGMFFARVSHAAEPGAAFDLPAPALIQACAQRE